jgi:hypothetical protein
MTIRTYIAAYSSFAQPTGHPKIPFRYGNILHLCAYNPAEVDERTLGDGRRAHPVRRKRVPPVPLPTVLARTTYVKRTAKDPRRPAWMTAFVEATDGQYATIDEVASALHALAIDPDSDVPERALDIGPLPDWMPVYPWPPRHRTGVAT